MMENKALCFIEDGLKKSIKFNTWINCPQYHLTVYIRLTKRLIDKQICDTIDLASVSVDEKFWHKGYFKKLLNRLEELAKTYHRTIYIESILNEYVMQYCLKTGYSLTPTNMSINLYRKF